jgi:hypothetical protein
VAMMTGFGLFLVAVLTAVLSRIFADEITARSPSLGLGVAPPSLHSSSANSEIPRVSSTDP